MGALFIGKNTVFLPVVNSTNSYATELLKNVNPPEGTVIVADHQTHGRGMRGNSWKSQPASNVTASVILYPSFLQIEKRFLLYQLTALACYDALAELLRDRQIDIRIKWPNDMLVNGRKIAGILIENTIVGSTISATVIGIGVNVNQDDFTGLSAATSLAALTGRQFDVGRVTSLILEKLEDLYMQARAGDHSTIGSRYHENLFALNARMNFRFHGEIVNLVVKGVAESGLLQVEDDNGRLLEADVKELEWRY